MDEHFHDRQPSNAGSRGEALRRGCADAARFLLDEAGWLMLKRIVWPAQALYDALGTRGLIGVFGGGGIAVAGIVAALIVAAPGGSGAGAGTTEAFVATPRPTPTTTVAPAPKPAKKVAKPSGPTLHGAPPSFSKSKDVRSAVGDGKAIATAKKTATTTGEGPAARGSSAGAGDTPAATARIGATPEASAAATSQAGILGKEQEAAGRKPGVGAGTDGLMTPPAPKAAKRVARHFAEAFVVYETGGVDSQVRQVFGATSTKQLSKALLKRPPRQPADVKVPRAKVVNVVAGPSRGKVYSVSVSLLRVGVTSELRLQMEQGVAKKWQVTNVLG